MICQSYIALCDVCGMIYSSLQSHREKRVAVKILISRIAAAVSAALFIIVGFAVPAQAAGYDSRRGPNTGSAVVLTYDDCYPSRAAFVEHVLAAERLGVALVLAPTGACVRRGVFDVEFARAHGQWVINHSVTHPDLRRLSTKRILAQLSAPGVDSNYGRPPYGAMNQKVRKAYAAKGMLPWLWTVDTNDWRRGKTQAIVVNYVITTARAGDTVLAHMQHKSANPIALGQIIAGLGARGLRVCPITTVPTPAVIPLGMCG